MIHVVTTGKDPWHSKVFDRTPPIFVPDENNANVTRQQPRYKGASLVAETAISIGTST